MRDADERAARKDVVRLRRSFDPDLRGDRLALQERGRDILLRAAHVELALGQQPELMGSGYPWEFGPGAIDPYQQGLSGETPERLRRRFAGLADDAKQLLRQLVEPTRQFAFPEPTVRLEHLVLPT